MLQRDLVRGQGQRGPGQRQRVCLKSSGGCGQRSGPGLAAQWEDVHEKIPQEMG